MRAFACLCVMYSHYVGYVLGAVNGVFAQLLDSHWESPSFLLTHVIDNPSETGVSVFFLITGFLIPYSLDKNSKASFLLQKALRIYPVYIAGSALMFFTSVLYTHWAGTVLPWGFKEWVASVSLLRDWMWIPSIDSLGWTLEVQLKMYVVYFLLKRLRILDNSFSLILTMAGGTALSMIISFYLPGFLEKNLRLYTTMYVIVFNVVFLLYGLIGIALYNYCIGKWDLKESLAAGAASYLFFYLALTRAPMMGEATVKSYTASAAIFVIAFLMRERIKISRALSFISKISFSVYVVHGLNGYYLLSVFDSMGTNPYVALAVTFVLCIIVSYAFYKVVEEPMSKLIKSVCRKQT